MDIYKNELYISNSLTRLIRAAAFNARFYSPAQNFTVFMYHGKIDLYLDVVNASEDELGAN